MSDHHHDPRVEDDALIRGRGKFVDDVEKQGVGHAVFVRSPHAHAKIVSIATEDAAKMPGRHRHRHRCRPRTASAR